jgi:hypothetical protein
MRGRRALIGMVLGMAVACGEPSGAQKEVDVEGTVENEVAAAVEEAGEPGGGVPGAPRVDERYQRTIDRAWLKAAGGENPAFACAGLKGRVMAGGEEVDAAGYEALYACNVTIPVRYFEAFLDRVAAGEKTCPDLMMEVTTQLPAMSLSIEGLREMAASFEAGGDEEAIATDVLASAVDDATRDRGLADPKRAVKDALAPRVREVCPEIAPVVLR